MNTDTRQPLDLPLLPPTTVPLTPHCQWTPTDADRINWRGLGEFAEAGAPHTRPGGEFAEGAGEWPDSISRRRFLTLLGASLGLAGLSGCRVRPSTGKILPYVHPPEGLVPGKPLYFATAMSLDGAAIG